MTAEIFLYKMCCIMTTVLTTAKHTKLINTNTKTIQKNIEKDISQKKRTTANKIKKKNYKNTTNKKYAKTQ